MKQLPCILKHDPQCRISVCMATYNGEKFIRDQIRSILSQLSRKDELVVSDDGSQDSTLTIIQGLADQRMRIVTNPHPKGVVCNFENALHAACGRYIFLADQDDIWHPAKVSTLLPLLERYDLIVSDCVLIDENGGVTHPSYFSLRRSGSGICKNVLANSYMGACMAFNRRVLEKALPFPKNIPMHDWWIGLIGDMFGKTCFYRDALVYYRRHGKNLSPLMHNQTYSPGEKMRMRIQVIGSLARKWMENRYRSPGWKHNSCR